MVPIPRKPGSCVSLIVQRAAASQVEDGRQDVLHVGAFIDQGPDHAGRQIGGRLGQVIGDQTHRVVAALAVPQQVEQHRPADEKQPGQREEAQVEDRPPTLLEFLLGLFRLGLLI